VAWKEFETEPLHGRGAGSYEAWWARHGKIPGFVQDAHSLYVETLGELGVVGLALLVLTFGSGFVVAGRRLLRASGDQRVALAAATASFFAYAVGAAADWMWELTIVSLVALVCLGLMVGPATALTPRLRPVEPAEPAPRPRLYRYGMGVAVIVAGWLAICAIAVPFMAGARLSDSQRAARRGDLATAVRAALDARSIQPWSSAPYQQIALLNEEAGNYKSAASWIRRALRRDVSDWRLWLARTRIEAEAGNVAAARRSVRMCRKLNPRSPLCRGA
jgi:tetratricopeptide (TPR) repeat protein